MTTGSTGQGRREEAIDGLEQVRRDFTARGLPYDAACCVDLAVLLKEGRTGEVKALAREMAPIFQLSEGMPREALHILPLREAPAHSPRLWSWHAH